MTIMTEIVIVNVTYYVRCNTNFHIEWNLLCHVFMHMIVSEQTMSRLLSHVIITSRYYETYFHIW